MLNESLRLIRNLNGLKAKDLAELLAISPSYLSEIEQGKKEPSLELIKKYSEVLNTKASKIIYLAEKMEECQNSSSLKAKLSSLAISILYHFDADTAEHAKAN